MSIDAVPLAGVALVWAVAALTPGPNFFIVARSAVARSRAAGLRVAFGIALGTAVWGLAGFFGIGALFAAAPALYAVLKIVGGLYLALLGLRLLLGALRGDGKEAARPNPAGGVRLGLLTSLANPKTAAFVASLFAATLPPEPPLALGLAAVATMTAIALMWYGSVALVLAGAGPAALYRRLARWIDGLAGAIFAGFGVALATRD